MTDVQFLTVLRNVLGQHTSDPKQGEAIYEAVAREVNLHKSVQSFEKFCATGALPDLTPETISNLQSELTGKFGEGAVAITPDEKGTAVAVEIALSDRTISTAVRVLPEGASPEDELKTPFVPFPVALPQDPGLVWVLGRREDLGPDEAARALHLIEEEFWQTKKGQQLQRDRVEKSFAEFIVQVPSASLLESGLKRHYKTAEPLQTLRLQSATAAA